VLAGGARAGRGSGCGAGREVTAEQPPGPAPRPPTETDAGAAPGVDGRGSSGVLPVNAMVAAARAELVGRTRDAEVVAAALGAGRSVLLEGPPGTGKTTLLRALTEAAGIPLVVVEGNAELSPGRLIGGHDPSRILAEGYPPDAFIPGPLVAAMTSGGLLYVEELNRVPEETLNVLLGVLSERRLHVPRLGQVTASATFRLVAAMNPYDAVGTGRITPALYDRTCRVALGYQSEAEEIAIVTRRMGLRAEATPSDAVPGGPHGGAVRDGPVPDRPVPAALVGAAVRAVRATRSHPELRVGSSVRGALDLVAVAAQLSGLRPGTAWQDLGADAASAALSGRVTRRDGAARPVEEIIAEIWTEATKPRGDQPGKATGPGRPPARTATATPSR
jgi:MoxR-like ATPase